MADVCVILEGTWPSVTGGVSTWVQCLLEGLDGVDVSVVHLRADETPSSRRGFTPPASVRRIVDVAIDPTRPDLDAAVGALVPEAAVYHALSSAWSGALAADVAARRSAPMLLTEHGIAWREARTWTTELETGRTPIAGIDWAAAITDLARRSYRGATHVTTVCRANARLQEASGVPEGRISVIPNAVPLPPEVPRVAPTPDAPRVGFIGRVVPIKDVVTFLRACALVRDAAPNATFVVAGPLDHDPEYASACQQLARELGLADVLTFTGTVDATALAADLDVVVLTSRSEGAPFALLEAMAAGTPVVASDVGGCREVVGDGGALTPVADPEATAAAILRLTGSASTWHDRSSRARAMAARRSPEQLVSAYRGLYERLSA
ncbi:MAG TPA: GT4 family glycosyltransferase PelF [Acidimicrobiales bacterium]|nr:GT4 family glycosyltransferase PelF [Acidimicrobiales bacterium]